MNLEIERFNRWQQTYLMWAYSNFDRIVSETVARHKKEMEEERRNNSDYMKQIRKLFKQSNLYFDKIAAEIASENLFMQGEQWKVGDVLKIKLR